MMKGMPRVTITNFLKSSYPERLMRSSIVTIDNYTRPQDVRHEPLSAGQWCRNGRAELLREERDLLAQPSEERSVRSLPDSSLVRCLRVPVAMPVFPRGLLVPLDVVQCIQPVTGHNMPNTALEVFKNAFLIPVPQ